MTLIIRQESNRRMAASSGFPLTDSRGLVVLKDRRRSPDRRKVECDIDDLKVILSKMAR
jgi:hypothetical protein